MVRKDVHVWLFYRGWCVRLSVRVYEKVRNKLAEIFDQVVVVFVFCVHISRCVCTHLHT